MPYIGNKNMPYSNVQYLCVIKMDNKVNGRFLCGYCVLVKSMLSYFIFFTIRLMLGSGCTSGTWEPIHVQQPLLSMDLTNHRSTTLLPTVVGKALVFVQ